MDKDFSCHMEQRDGQSDSFPHEQHQQQQDDLKQQNQSPSRFWTWTQSGQHSNPSQQLRTVKVVAATAYTSRPCPLSRPTSASSFATLTVVSFPYSLWSM